MVFFKFSIWWLALLLTTLPCAAIAQGSKNSLDEKKWESLTLDRTYEESFPEEKQQPDTPRNINYENENLNFFLKVLLFISIAAFLLFVILKTMGSDSLFSKKDKKLSGQPVAYSLADAEQNLPARNLENLIGQATKNENYKLALRLGYLKIIQVLSTHDKITWQKDKTNRDYLYELAHTDLEDDFKNVTAIYEVVWFGERAVKALQYQRLVSKFDNFIAQIELSAQKIKSRKGLF